VLDKLSNLGNFRDSIIKKIPLIAYVSANRIGHQAWETLMHCSYTNCLKRKLVIFYPNNAANRSFDKLCLENVRFVNLSRLLIPFLSLKIHGNGLKTIKLLIGNAFKKKNNVQKKSCASPRESNIRSKYSRFANDTIGTIIDIFTRLLPSLFSQPWSEYGKEYFNFSLLSEHSQPLSIKEKYEKQGELLLHSLGLNVNDWFVCLHARESTFLGDSFREWQNQSIENYVEAIKYITKQGGHVIRMGDPSMRPEPIVKGLIDYVHSVYKSDFGDLYLSSKAKFCIVNNSGYRVLPELFHVPLLTVNYYPISPVDFYQETLIIYKKVYSNILKKELSIEDILEEPNMCHYNTNAEYEAAGLCVLENTKEEILEAVKDMFSLLENNPGKFTPAQKLFQTLSRQAIHNSTYVHRYGNTIFYPDAICKIAPSYLKKVQG
jgi:putative glycosyltransferase (TIGR04372 family)